MLPNQDEEINTQSQLVSMYQEQLLEQEELIASNQCDHKNALAEIARLQALSNSSNSEMKEVLQRLKELAENYNIKEQEVWFRDNDIEQLNDELIKKKVCHSRSIVTLLFCVKVFIVLQKCSLILSCLRFDNLVDHRVIYIGPELHISDHKVM